MLEAAPDPVFIVGTKGSIERINAQAERLFSYYRRDMRGNPYSMLIPQRFRVRDEAYATGCELLCKPLEAQVLLKSILNLLSCT